MSREIRKCSLLAVLQSSIDFSVLSAINKGISVLWKVDAAVPLVIATDEVRLKQVLVNLLSNAVKFSSSDTPVSVRVKVEGDMLHFGIQDHGIGMTPDQMTKLFQSFSQVDDSTTRKYGGSGLGLAISKKLVELLGGAIWAESESDKGSTFQ